MKASVSPASTSPSPRTLVIAACWVSSLVLTYLVATSPSSAPGRQSHGGSDGNGRPADDDGTAPQRAREDGLPADGSLDERARSSMPSSHVTAAGTATAAGEIPPLGNEEIRQYLGPALQSDDLVLRSSIVGHMLSRLTLDNVDAVRAVFESTPRSYHTDNDYRLFLHAWAKLDGAAALEYIRNNPDAHRVRDGQVWAMSGWAQADPAAALDFVNAQSHEDHRLYHGFLRGWARTDLEGAGAHVESIEDQRLQQGMVGVLGESYLEQFGAAGALDWAADIRKFSQDEDFARMVFDDVMKRAAPHDALEVADWISAHADDPAIQPWMFEHAAGNLADRHPDLAAGWVEDHLEDDRINVKVVSRVAGEWAERSPVDAANWVEGFRDTELFNPGVAAHLAATWAVRDSDSAFDWVDELEPDYRREAYGAIVGRMPKSELPLTGEWIRENPVDPILDNARVAYAWRTFQDDPVVALEEAQRIANDERRNRNLVPLAQAVYKQDPDTVTEWLPSSGLDPDLQQRVLHGDRRGRQGR